MKIKSLNLLLAALILFALVMSVDTQANEPQRMERFGYGIRMAENNLYPGHFLLKIKDEIGLTPEQVAKIEKLNSVFQELQIRRESDIKIAQLKSSELLKDEKTSRAKIEKAIRDCAQLRTEMQIAHINYLLDVKEVLTAEQLKKIDGFKSKFRGHFRDHMQERPDRIKEK